jgi:7-cyano-7-deazaguanine synthase
LADVLLLLSGGLDSAVLLGLFKAGGLDPVCVFFDYGQPAYDQELRASRELASHYGVFLTECALPLPRPPDVLDQESWVVPGRNAVFLSMGLALAAEWGCSQVAIGTERADGKSFGDSTPGFLSSMDRAVQWASGGKVGVLSPLIGLWKPEVIRLGREVGVPLTLSWSCWRGGVDPCRRCEACRVRDEAFEGVASAEAGCAIG